MIDWEKLESPEEAPQAPKSDVSPRVDISPGGPASAIAHWKHNLERFAPGHIGHQYALEALAHLSRFDKDEESEA